MTSFPDNRTSQNVNGFDALVSSFGDDSRSLTKLFSAFDDAVFAFAFRHEEPLSWWSDRVADLTGRSETDLASQRAGALVTESDRERFDAACTTALDDGNATVSVGFVTADGRERSGDCHLVRLPESDHLFGVAELAEEPPERTAHERDLERYETMFDTVNDGIYALDDEFYLLAVNEAMEELTGYGRDELVGAHGSLISDDETVSEAFRQRERLLDGERDVGTYEIEIRRADGETVPVEVRFTSLPSEDGTFEGTVGVMRDISERVERERRLQLERDRVAALFEDSGDATVYCEYEGDVPTIRSVNAAFERTFGYPVDEMVGRSIDDVVLPTELAAEGKAINRRVKAGEYIEDEVRRETADGVRDFFLRSIPVHPGESGEQSYAVYTDITERKERKRELEETKTRLESVVENVPVILFALDADGRYTLCEGRGLAAFDTSSEEVIGESVFDSLSEYPEAIADVRRALSGEPVNAVHELENLHLETWFQPMHDEDGEVTGVIGVSMDVTARMRHEQALTALHTATQEMLEASSTEEVARIAADAGASVLDLPGVVVFLFDEETNTLEPVAHSDDVPPLVGPPVSFEAGESITWQVFATGETRVFDDVRESEHVYNPETRLRSGLYVPLGNHGVFMSVDDEPGTFETDAVELATVFAATTQAALDRVSREAALRKREHELEEQAARLERLHETTELLRDIEHLLVLADSRSDVVDEVCERLAATDRFSMAWVGTLDEATSKVVPEAWSGMERGYLDSVSLELEADSTTVEPAVSTVKNGSLTTVMNVAGGVQREAWRFEALTRGYQSVIGIPLVYREYSYGVLMVYATRSNAFDALSQAVFTELGETIAYTIDALETKRGLLTDRSVELDFRVTGSDDLLQRLATSLDCRVTYEGIVNDEETDHLFITVHGTDVDAVEAYLDEAIAVKRSRPVTERDDEALFEITVTEPLIPSVFGERGAVPESITATEERIRAVVTVPPTTEVRELVETLRTRYSGLELAARRDRERPVQTVQTCRAAFEEGLTDRQQQVLKTAYLSGYFDSPRGTTGQEVAKSLGITQPTFINHLRTAQRKLFDRLYEVE
ncbi:putative PAS/PAC sensor protein [Haladaptatus paucihalophilus DX253]|uniref:PAS domain S-box-containing protein n=1 Tax=Haladaptatus paucihalophilus DX253 TaxID=797209 RepID=E7QY27_HALPU|nr:PAS domain S-box protein [Haladaptatus paucihalophilus]EFW90493.1 putative PAS/PAC sensor protein [Haladaptatus paucihalophilus DX253]SHK78610.1 PAS domain S-box-containing protein [Haladaptatus paucihalophilus DX253]